MTPEELMADIKSGSLITSTFGPNVSLVTGDYSVGVAGLWIENGVPAYPVNEITVAGNLKDMFRNMTPASDLEFRRGVERADLAHRGHDRCRLMSDFSAPGRHGAFERRDDAGSRARAKVL